MTSTQEQIKLRFTQLAEDATKVPMLDLYAVPDSELQSFYAWVSSALNLIQGVFGKNSPHYERLNAEVSGIRDNHVSADRFSVCRGIFLGAKGDVDGGYVFNLEAAFTGEVFGDFITAAKQALNEQQHTVAAVLASAALEDALKRYARANNLVVAGKTMEEVVNALKGAGLVVGAQKTILSAMPKIRNHAMHADWDKLTPADALSVVGFAEQFLLTHFR